MHAAPSMPKMVLHSPSLAQGTQAPSEKQKESSLSVVTQKPLPGHRH
jgi:hypothetical protein